MIRRLFRMLAGWCWAMYLVAVIFWIVALVISFAMEIRGTVVWGDWVLHEGVLEAFASKLTYRHRGYPATWQYKTIDFIFPGVEYKRADTDWFECQLRVTADLITLVALAPLIAAMAVRRWRRGPSPATDPHPRPGGIGRLLLALETGVILWLIVGLVFMQRMDDKGFGRFCMGVGTPKATVLICKVGIPVYAKKSTRLHIAIGQEKNGEDSRSEFIRHAGPGAFVLRPGIEVPFWALYGWLGVLLFVAQFFSERIIGTGPGQVQFLRAT